MSDPSTSQTRLQHSISRALDNFKKIGKNNLTVAKIQSRINTLKETWIQFQEGHDVLYEATPSAQRATDDYFQNCLFEATEDIYNTSLDYMADCLEELEKKHHTSPPADDTRHSDPAAGPNLNHLPPINLPPFSGDYDEWENYRDKFTSLILKNRALSDFTRIHYLMSSLSGRALESVRDISVTAENLKVAWKTLETRFTNPRRLLSNHLATLLNLEAIPRESATALNSLRDKVRLTLSSLSKLNRSNENLWHDILVHILSQKLDPVTRKAWTHCISDSRDPPSYERFEKFLESSINALEDLNSATTPKPSSRVGVTSKIHAATVSVASTSAPAASQMSTTKPPCPLCNAHHYLSDCPEFVRSHPSKRRDLAKSHRRCFNCLSSRHSAQECRSKYSCRLCNKRHHTLLHVQSENQVQPADPPSTVSQKSAAVDSTCKITAAIAHKLTKFRPSALLATAWVTVGVSSGRFAVVRAFLDQGSEMTFISENLAQLLRAPRVCMPTSIAAVGGIKLGTVRHATQITVAPRNSSTPVCSATALIMTSLTSYTPKNGVDVSKFKHLSDLEWADSDPTSSDQIDILIGADLYAELLLDGIRKGSPGEPIAQNTKLGWVIWGPLAHSILAQDDQACASSLSLSPPCISVQHCLCSDALENEVRRFWEIEEVPRRPSLSPLDAQCEEHFLQTHSRESTGRYVVRLPFIRGPPINIGESRWTAEKCLKSLLGRLQRTPTLQREYENFLCEYEQLGHMQLSPFMLSSVNQVVYIPHHPVVRNDSLTTRLRTVFNASSKTTNATSLNDHLHAGPKLQKDLATVIIRWRRWKFVYTADIPKMYRQIKVDPRDVDFQRILWQPVQGENYREFQLLTVTYGMACAPFLALRVIQQLAQDEGNHFPSAAEILRHDTYVDDVLFGADDLDQLRTNRDALRSLLKRGGFELHKWTANHSALLSDIDDSNHGLACDKSLSSEESVKILGIAWNPANDAFIIHVTLSDQVPNTKRSILSVIAKFYDPLGWVTPVTVAAKILMQHLWRQKLEWDQIIPAQLCQSWSHIYTHLQGLNNLQIPRWFGLRQTDSHAELHGFSDASNAAYAAAVYLKVTASDGNVEVTLVAGKSKVAPLSSLSIPRLELSAAVLLVRLIEFVRSSLAVKEIPCFCWTDSTVVLAWVSQSPSRWKTFVANRVADIQTRGEMCEWRHVGTADNPADCASRGILGTALTDHPLWWHGPSWLRLSSNEWPNEQSPPPPLEHLEVNSKIVVHHCASTISQWDLAEKFSSWPRLIRVTAYILKFIRLCKRKLLHSSVTAPPLSVQDCALARAHWIRYIQSSLFSMEIACLESTSDISSRSPVISLRPFLDKDKILRVGGRLKNAPVAFDVRHPILLAAHPLVTLIIRQAHERAMHAGLQLTLSILRHDFWILRGRTLVKSIIRSCVTCTRERAAVPEQLMGDLPIARVSRPSRCFQHCGVDYAGPVHVRASAGRGVSSRKSYIALFICLASKAIHLELVSDYTTAAFINAFSRFCARRGLPEAMYSDNGTTFVGANREMIQAYRSAIKDPNFLSTTASDNIQWHFIPPSAPHFGGLWEAGVRSVKHHLRRVLGDHKLTFEEFSTLLCRIEAVLNSRPLAALSDSLHDYEYLTPGHLAVGTALTLNPEPSVVNLNENRLSRWQLVQHMNERFWKRWQTDYVNTLQQRAKWKKVTPQITRGQLVLLRNSSLPPGKWELGRVIQCHAGVDGIVRVVTVKTAHSEYKRPIVKLCVLPVKCDTVH